MTLEAATSPIHFEILSYSLGKLCFQNNVFEACSFAWLFVNVQWRLGIRVTCLTRWLMISAAQSRHASANVVATHFTTSSSLFGSDEQIFKKKRLQVVELFVAPSQMMFAVTLKQKTTPCLYKTATRLNLSVCFLNARANSIDVSPLWHLKWWIEQKPGSNTRQTV